MNPDREKHAHEKRAYETRHARGATLATHRHREAYVALVLDGDYIESSLDGPLRCQPGSLVLHPAFHAHGDRFGRIGARAVNLPLPPGLAVAAAMLQQAHHLAEAREVFMRCPERLGELLACATPAPKPELPEWQAALMQALADSDEAIGVLARRLGVSAEHASRTLGRSHGMPPNALRREARWRKAAALLSGDTPLAEVAATAGFADQSHFHRVTRACAGCTPAELRRRLSAAGAEAGAQR